MAPCVNPSLNVAIHLTNRFSSLWGVVLVYRSAALRTRDNHKIYGFGKPFGPGRADSPFARSVPVRRIGSARLSWSCPPEGIACTPPCPFLVPGHSPHSSLLFIDLQNRARCDRSRTIIAHCPIWEKRKRCQGRDKIFSFCPHFQECPFGEARPEGER